ncbi:MAG: sodium/proton-translocating pyrophosphatase, partial [Gemmatimonadales bacterium]|nr:sodium/proton-translocating pyrophosphatase [Gemmatimonadales bacterium]
MSQFAFLPMSAIAAGVVGLIIAWFTFGYIRRQPAGSDRMREIQEMIHTGAMAFLKREYTYLLPFLAIVAALLAFMIGWPTALAYVGGGLCSILAGLFGMQAATSANARTSEAARAKGQAMALRIAFNGGAVMGLSVASLGLLGIGLVIRAFLGSPESGDAWKQFS